MSVRKYTMVERTLHIAKCVCGARQEWADKPPKEWLCPNCRQWITPERVTFESKEYERAR